MPSDRLSHVSDRLDGLLEQLAGLEESHDLSPMEEQTRLKLRIKKLKAEIQPVEQEYWQLLATQSASLTIPEPEAEVAVGEIVETVTQLEVAPTIYSAELLQCLQAIRDRLTQSDPKAPASAKLKGVLSTVPPFIGVAYEGELDLEAFFQQNFPTFRRVIQAATRKK